MKTEWLADATRRYELHITLAEIDPRPHRGHADTANFWAEVISLLKVDASWDEAFAVGRVSRWVRDLEDLREELAQLRCLEALRRQRKASGRFVSMTVVDGSKDEDEDEDNEEAA